MRGPRNGLTLNRHRVVLLDPAQDQIYVAIVETLDGIPLAMCYRIDVAERIARALEGYRQLEEAVLGKTTAVPCEPDCLHAAHHELRKDAEPPRGGKT